MNKYFKPIIYLLAYLLINGLLAFNFYQPRFWWLGLIAGAAYLIFYGYAFGCLLFKKNHLLFKIFYGLFSLLSLLSLVGAVLYYILNLNLAIIATFILLLPIIFFLFLFKKNNWLNFNLELNQPESSGRNQPLVYFLILIYLGLTTFSFWLLHQAQTADTLRSPWEALPNLFLIVYLINCFILMAIVSYNKRTYLSLFLIFLQYFLTLSLTVFIYQLGYGFDSFIHQATEKTIAQFGSISPKPFYYVGQYSLVVILSKLLFLPVAIIDKFLVPVMASLFLPATIYTAFSRGFNWDKKYALVLSLLFLILPFGQFIVTTPQGLANIYFLVVIFFSLLYITRSPQPAIMLYLTFLAATALLIHPLTGIPLLIFIILLIFYTYFVKTNGLAELIRQSIFWEIFALCSIALPLVFILNSSLTSSGLSAAFNLEVFKHPLKIIELLNPGLPIFQKLFYPLYDFVYFYQFYLSYALIALALIGLVAITKKHQLKSFGVYFATFSALLANFILLKTLILFPSLIYYEQADYPQRIWQLGLYFLLPFLFFLIYHFMKTSREKKIYSLQLGLLVFFSLFITASLYLSYPRHDHYQVGHGYSVGAADIKTVNYIAKDAGNKDYVVLANQTVAAAAIKELGFKKYYKNNFFYPIPTGGPLYQIFLKMVYDKPYRETAQEAKKLTGVKTVYFVLNNYWYNAQSIAELAAETADKWAVIDGGKTYVFRYDFR